MPKTITILTTVLLLAGGAARAAPDAGDEYAGKSCDAAGCHADLVDDERIHAAIEEGGCELCHEAADGGHAFEPLPDPVAELCSACHDDPTEGRPEVHAPAAMGECTTCHDPHASSEPALLPLPHAELCGMCHDDIAEASMAAHPHGAVTEFGCVVCHDPHASDTAFMLIAAGNALCFGCHPPAAGPHESGALVASRVPEERLSQIPRIALDGTGRGHPVILHPVSGVGDPLRKDEVLWCGSCHDPHGTERSGLRRVRDGSSFCGQCHSR